MQAFVAGFMVSYQTDDKEGIGSVFQMLELVHTHFTLSDLNNNGRKGSKKSNSPNHDSKVTVKSKFNKDTKHHLYPNNFSCSIDYWYVGFELYQ